VGPHGGLTTADVDVEDLHLLQLVDHALGLGRGELLRVAPPRRGQTVHAREVARVRQLPGEADRGVEAVLEVLDQLHVRSSMVPLAASPASARRETGRCGWATFAGARGVWTA